MPSVHPILFALGAAKSIAHGDLVQFPLQSNYPPVKPVALKYGLHFCLLHNRLLGKPHILEEWVSPCGDDLIVNAPPEPCSLFDEQAHGKLHQDSCEAAHKGLSSDIAASKLRDTCIPSLSDLSCLCCSLKPPSRDFERSTS